MVSPHFPKKHKVALGISGGVDSSVAAVLLLQQGYEVTGVYLQCWDFKADGCTALEDKNYAVQVCSRLGLKFKHLDFVTEYKARVIEYFYAEYAAGRTPNPDVMCNKEIKFGLFYIWALENGFDMVATGHYAQVFQTDKTFLLKKGVDPKKDQSYFLYRLQQEQLAKILFPVGDLTKAKVRKLAAEAGLPTAVRSESMGICFIGEVDLKEFLMKRLAIKQGDVVDTLGNVIGVHDGAWFYTIGQRHGFKVTKYSGDPLYVLKRDVLTNTLVVGSQVSVYGNEFSVTDVAWVSGKSPLPLVGGVRIRHLGQIYPCEVDLTGRVRLQKPAFGISIGQSAVFYADDVVLGGGIITL